MDNEILEQLQNISKQLEKVVKLMEEAKAAPAKKEGFGFRKSFDKFDKKPFGDKKGFGDKRSFGDKKGFGDKKPFGKKDFHPRKPRFDDDGKPRFIADGRGFDRRGKRF